MTWLPKTKFITVCFHKNSLSSLFYTTSTFGKTVIIKRYASQETVKVVNRFKYTEPD